MPNNNELRKWIRIYFSICIYCEGQNGGIYYNITIILYRTVIN